MIYQVNVGPATIKSGKIEVIVVVQLLQKLSFIWRMLSCMGSLRKKSIQRSTKIWRCILLVI